MVRPPYSVTGRKLTRSGAVQWQDIISAAMLLQSQNALGQPGLLIGPEGLLRVDVEKDVPAIELDDWRTAVALLPSAATRAVETEGRRVANLFLREPAGAFSPAVPMNAEAGGDGCGPGEITFASSLYLIMSCTIV